MNKDDFSALRESFEKAPDSEIKALALSAWKAGLKGVIQDEARKEEVHEQRRYIFQFSMFVAITLLIVVVVLFAVGKLTATEFGGGLMASAGVGGFSKLFGGKKEEA